MENNRLRVGEPRLCRLIDGDPETSGAVVMLRDTGNAIEATFPIAGMVDSGGSYDRWWSRGVTYGDDPDYSYSPPSVMLLYDDNGSVVLIGCRATEWKRTLNAGRGVIVADFAVIGGESLDYGKINGMRTASPAYSQWMGGSSISVNRDVDQSDRLQSLTLSLKRVEDFQVSQRFSLSARWDWRVMPVLGGYDVRESLVFQTVVEDPREWSAHLNLHLAVLDLISIAAWKNCAFSEIYVNRRDDPEKALAGNILGVRWAEVMSRVLPGDDVSDCGKNFLFTYNDASSGVIDIWFQLKMDYGRALDYLLRILRSGHTWSPQSAVISSIALEQLGYLIEDHDNSRSHLDNRGQLHFKDALGVILDDMEAIPIGCDDVEGWKERCRNVYMGAKHADREEADHLTMLNTLRENLLVLRYWIAQRLGVSGDVLERNLARDPLKSGFVAGPDAV
ncbi:hypothetical protein [uncultured Actinomyces sp.]|jgi:hypothetical protein|uniref:ApeA N-terminal domain 1-containing protein n=1 Tax=uncultured Actinomyces sp. TaxID=249061 RepID=UPI0028E7E360|nr:hypothetical protein [uncultured Actinomyces sp.]